MKIVVLLVVVTSPAKTQTPEPKRKTFHVVKVQQSEAEDWCMIGTCIATKIEVSGFTRKNRRIITYKLECIEVVQRPPAKVASTLCIHVEAGEDYVARIFPDAVMFGENQHVEGAMILLYDIVSQREER